MATGLAKISKYQKTPLRQALKNLGGLAEVYTSERAYQIVVKTLEATEETEPKQKLGVSKYQCQKTSN